MATRSGRVGGNFSGGRRWALAAAAAVALTGAAWGQPVNDKGPAAGAVLTPHSDTAFARELRRLGQTELLKRAAEDVKGTPGAELYSSAAIFSDWMTIKKDRAAAQEAAKDYLAAVQKYVDANPTGIDGGWALDQSKFIFAEISEPIINRMEYWASSERDRKALAPMANLAAQLMKISEGQLTAALAAAERAKPFNEEVYMKVMDSLVEVRYYGAWAQYFLALAMEPGSKDRGDVLLKAAQGLGEWADEPESNVRFQALLLRGKIYSEAGKVLPEAGKPSPAVADLTTAADPKAPDWVQYQARYQIVVATTRSKDFKAAEAELEKFRSWIGQQTSAATPEAKLSAQVSADMLGYRVAAAAAEAQPAGPAREAAKAKAMGVLAGIVARAPSFRELVYDQLASQIPDSANPAELPPLQALAWAWTTAQSAKGGDTEADKGIYRKAEAIALAVRSNKAASPSEQQDALYLAAYCARQADEMLQGVKLSVEFAELLPKDPRAEKLLAASLADLGKIRADAEKRKTTVPAEVAQLTQRAIDLRVKQGGKEWLFAQGVTAEERGDVEKAELSYLAIASTDSKYIDAQYRLLRIALEKLNKSKDDPAKRQRAARDLLSQCTKYLTLLDTAKPEERDRVRPLILGLRLIEVSTALNPLGDYDSALRGLKTMEEDSKKYNLPISTDIRGAMLRYRVQAYQMANQRDEVMKTLKELKAEFPKDAPSIIRGMVYTYVQEIDQIQESDPVRSQELAGTVADLLQSLIDEGKSIPEQKKEVYGYRQLRADMLSRGGKPAEAIKVWKELQAEKKAEQQDDFLNYMGEARAMYANKQYKECEDYFTRLMRQVTIGSDPWWECYLRIFQCIKAQGKPLDGVKKTLKDMKAGYGNDVGGQNFKKEYHALMAEVGLAGEAGGP